jgi:iron complex outermembrane receptor protein
VVAEAEAEFTSSYFADDANTMAARNDGATVVNLRVRSTREFGRTGLAPFAAINNVTNRRYNGSVVINAAGARYFEPAPGRNFFVGLGIRLARERGGN